MSIARDGSPVDPNAVGYINDGFGGQNAICRIKEEVTGKLTLAHNPDEPAYLSVSDDRLVLKCNIYLFDLKNNQILKIIEHE